jgi:hypothetical protein
MPVDIKDFTKDWIQFLKNNQIVALQSDPKTGKLTYKKKVTSDLLTKFLKNRTDLDDDVIANAIRQATSKPGGGKQAFGNMAQQLAPKATNRGGKKSGEISDTPDAIRKRNARSQGGRAFSQMGKTLTTKPALQEEFIDKTTDMSEEDVEEVFALLQPHLAGTKSAPETGETAEVDPTEQLDQIKSIINRMSPAQRKEMWTALNDTTLTEATLEKSNIEDVFRAASKIKSVKFDTINQEWKKAGYPTDSEDIKKILKGLGYGSREIDKVFSSIFPDTADDPTPNRSKGIAIIMDHVKKAGLKDELIAFMQEKYGEELNKPPEPEDRGLVGKARDLFNKGLEKASGWFNNKLGEMTYPQIEQVFKAILLEERTGLKEQETRNLGRSRKSI